MLEYRHFPFTTMGTACNLHLYCDGAAAADRVIRAAVAEVKRLEAKYSRYLPDSVLSGINRTAALGGEMSLDDETAGLLDYAWTCYAQSAGLFDISSGILRRAWNFDTGHLPEQHAIDAQQDRVGLNRIEWRKPVIRFPVADMELDFGGIAKEYAADQAAAVCRSLGVRHGLLDLGGDMAVIGPHPDGRPWQIGIRSPDRPNALAASVELARGGLASSGDYERCVVVGGRRYGHILDPRTGWPVQGLSAVSVVAERCTVAGSISTIAMLMGVSGGAWLRSLGVPHVCIETGGHQQSTPQFRAVA